MLINNKYLNGHIQSFMKKISHLIVIIVGKPFLKKPVSNDILNKILNKFINERSPAIPILTWDKACSQKDPPLIPSLLEKNGFPILGKIPKDHMT